MHPINVYSTVYPLLLGVALAVIVRAWVSPDASSKLVETAETASLKFILPLFLFESILRVPLDASLLLAILAGFAMPLVCLLVASWFTAGVGLRGVALRFLASTFGGGNRGSAFLVLLFVALPDFGEYLKWFALVDLGNFLALLLVVAPAIQRRFGALPAARPGWRALAGNYVLLTFVVVAGCFALLAAWPAAEGWLAESAGWRKALFTALVFFAIAAKLTVHALDARLAADIGVFAAIRMAAALFIVVPLWLASALPQPALMALLVLFAMPPSSILPAMVAQSSAPEAVRRHVNDFAGASNLAYVAAIAVAALFAG